MSKDGIEKKYIQLKKEQRNWVNLVNPQNSWLGSWDCDNLIEKNIKTIIKFNSQSTQCWKMKSIEKNRVNTTNLWFRSWNQIKITS